MSDEGDIRFEGDQYHFHADGTHHWEALSRKKFKAVCDQQFPELRASNSQAKARVRVVRQGNGIVSIQRIAEPLHVTAPATTPPAAAGPARGPAASAPGRSAALPDGRRVPAAPGPARFISPGHHVPFPAVRPLRDQPLGDGRPAGHDRWHHGRWSGTLDITVTAMSPLLITNPVDEAVRAVVVDREGRPSLSGAAIKGMLRSVYEQVTGARLGVLDDWSTPLTVRRTAQAALTLKPAWVAASAGGQRTLTVVDSLSPRATLTDPFDGTPQPDVRVPAYFSRARDRVELRPGAVLRDGALVDAWVHLVRHPEDRQVAAFLMWRASVVAPAGAPLGDAPAEPPLTDGMKVAPCAAIRVRGLLHVTGRTFGKRKHDERLVVQKVLAPQAAAITTRGVTLSAGAVAGWRTIVDSYATSPASSGREAAYRRDAERWRRLDVGRTCFLDEEHGRCQPLPAMVGRDVFDRSPLDLLTAGTSGDLRPAARVDDLSPADRVFGWAADRSSPDPAGAAEPVDAHRGQVRVGAVRWRCGPVEAVTGAPHRLPAQASPKPQAYRDYVRTAGGDALPRQPKSPAAGYAAGQRLAGAKVYVTDPEMTREPVGLPRVPDGVDAGMGTAVTSWIPRGACFDVRLHFDDLHARELGALLWVVDLPDGHYLKLGMGRPLGLGLVKVATAASLALESRPFTAATSPEKDTLEARYWSLEPAPVAAEPDEQARNPTRDLRADFDAWLRADMPQVRDAVMAAARGFDGHPVHYPRAVRAAGGKRVVKHGETYEWWVLNEKLKKYAARPVLRTAQPPLQEYLPPPPARPRR